MTDMITRGRFAPSPSGRMHLGNIYSALLSYVSAKHKNGEWIIRIEDLDRQRCKREYADKVIDDLHWMGMRSDAEIVYQSDRDAIYEAALSKLSDKGLTYGCYCRRADILSARAPHESDGRVVYSGRCRHLSDAERLVMEAERKPATRVIVADKTIDFTDGHYGHQSMNLACDCGDFIVRRADGNFAYQLAVVVDDAEQGVTEVVRGRDLMDSSHQQIYLYNMLGYDVPQFYHLPLLMSETGHRLAKRDACTDMGFLREAYTKEGLIGHIMFLAGVIDRDEPLTLNEAVDMFDWENVRKDSGITISSQELA
ncbi:MAG: tRNA glutamyl-Q(34) synthetase GluQRS [Bacteroidales bacterium]|nr:tRNA glutamyl-Q(34) synthetase GluQRS [Bacteroidales bacterium]